MKKFLSIFLFSLTAVVLAACGNDDTTKDEKTKEQLSVYTTVYPLQYFTQEIGGEFVDVQSIYPAGANEHSFEPTQKDMMALADSDIFFYIGQGLEGFVENAKKTLANEDVKLVATADAITEEQLHISTGHSHAEEEAHDEHEGHDHGETAHDPHVWLSPVISKDLALTIKKELVAAMPANEATFTENYNTLVAELDVLHKEFDEMAAATTSKSFFVSHAAFGYIAGHYGFTQVPIAGLNSQSEPSQKELASIVDLAKEKNVNYIFFEQNVSSNLAKVIQQEVGANTLILHNLSVLTSDDVKNNETYFTLMRKNIEALKLALQ